MNITVYLGALEGNDPALGDAVRELVHGLEKAEILWYMEVQSPVLWDR